MTATRVYSPAATIWNTDGAYSTDRKVIPNWMGGDVGDYHRRKYEAVEGEKAPPPAKIERGTKRKV